jgi:2-keto-4-pentenoate hydratase/2-oxohepta-3-ene-1,7-dioic acid hydratase in catechol pathway
MNIVRFKFKDEVLYGNFNGDKNTITIYEGTPFSGFFKTNEKVKLSEVEILTPCDFSKAVCIGLNYRDHAIEFDLPIPKSPIVFLKPSTSALAHKKVVIKPEMCNRLDYEAELAVVIKKEAKNVKREEAFDYILGYTCANDITARDLQPKTGQWTIAKSFDTFCPFGFVINTELDPSNLKISSKVNGKVMQESNTKNLIFDVPYLVSYLSSIMTLLPGDIILTGTPGGISGMQKNDKVEIIIEGLPPLVNTVG